MSPSRSPPLTRGGMESLSASLEQLDTERQWLEALPALIERHGKEKVSKAMTTFFSRSQQSECFKRLKTRAEQLIWIHLAARGTQLEMAIVITTRSLDEVDRGAWLIGGLKGNEEKNLLSALPTSMANGNGHSKTSPLTREAASAEIVELLATHCERGTCTLSGVSLGPQVEMLARVLPAVVAFIRVHPSGAIHPSERCDLARSGVQQYAALLELPMLPTAEPGALRDFERDQRDGDVSKYVSAKSVDATDHVEAAIMSLGWARCHLIAPPKAAKYVTAGLIAMAVCILGSIGQVLVYWALGDA